MLVLIPDRLGVLDPHPLSLGDPGDGGHHARVHPRGDGEVGLRPAQRGDDVVLVERTVGAPGDLPADPGPPGGGHRLGDHPLRAAR